MKAEPLKEHQWLQKLAGEWIMTSDEAPTSWSENVRSLDGIWVVAEGEGEMPGGGAATTIMTLGYDPHKKRYIGTWVGSMMSHMWLYEGALDETGNVLTLETEGPDFWTEGRRAKYQDIIAFEDDDRRVLTSRMLNDDGTWKEVMSARYRRNK
ncbi:DUF1579 domain-containing protein [Microvirga alba]|uniref:DUF1579 domain-containing protein n=1 Tax=Microvirga alba TaxID=2791025 RepID=A0A931BPB1_9HYPH|nr:DUF1579 domain-containing protein [Microvirga alba]MBF9233184.1 DUF1579 domain-containing protein [Microvirga alba]